MKWESILNTNYLTKVFESNFKVFLFKKNFEKNIGLYKYCFYFCSPLIFKDNIDGKEE